MGLGFNALNSINEYNKVFQEDMSRINADIQGQNDFNEIFDSINNQIENPTFNAGIAMNVGADAINAQKVENLSDSARMMNTFGNSITGAINSLNETQREAEHAIETLATGGDISIHDVMIASKKSGLAMQMAIQLRNQALNMYNEFKNMGI
ncbi:flagellar hook-basal body complex protein FliE [bacterium]|nr:flagellar hook-basal body complex protein FliE [bacterium]